MSARRVNILGDLEDMLFHMDTDAERASLKVISIGRSTKSLNKENEDRKNSSAPFFVAVRFIDLPAGSPDEVKIIHIPFDPDQKRRSPTRSCSTF